MLLKRRKHGSQRAMHDLEVEILPILSSAEVEITFKAGGIYYVLTPQTASEARLLRDEAETVCKNRSRKESQ